jgi:hypothetical protein
LTGLDPKIHDFLHRAPPPRPETIPVIFERVVLLVIIILV